MELHRPFPPQAEVSGPFCLARSSQYPKVWNQRAKPLPGVYSQESHWRAGSGRGLSEDAASRAMIGKAMMDRRPTKKRAAMGTNKGETPDKTLLGSARA